MFPFSIPSQLKLYFINVAFVSLSISLTNVPKEESSHRLHGQFEKLNNHWINWTCLKSSALNAVERFSILCYMDDNFHGKSSIDFPHKMVLGRWRIEWALHQCATIEKNWYFRSQKSLKIYHDKYFFNDYLYCVAKNEQKKQTHSRFYCCFFFSSYFMIKETWN